MMDVAVRDIGRGDIIVWNDAQSEAPVSWRHGVDENSTGPEKEERAKKNACWHH